MDVTDEQMPFLADLRKVASAVVAALDAGTLGPLIRAVLVRWDDDPAETAGRERPPGTPSTHASLGEHYLTGQKARDQPTE